MMNFLTYKQKVLNYFDECISFAKANGFKETVLPMEESRKIVEENKLVIVTCGEIRRGKSSMLSALLEEEGIFPVDVSVTTNLVTMACYGEVERITVLIDDKTETGETKVIDRSQIRDYVTEQGNENNHKNAKMMIVETPNKRLKNGLTFVDTPGVGSLNPDHSQITYGFLPRADVVLFVSDANATLTEPELGFLRQIKRFCDNILFVLTKKDNVQTFETIISENKQKIEQYAEIPQDKITYIPISSTTKLQYLKTGKPLFLKSSNFEVFEKAIWDMIAKNRARIIIAPPLGELAQQLKVIEKDIHIKVTALSDNKEDLLKLQNRLQQLQEDRQQLLSDGASWQSDINRELENVSFDVSAMINEYQKSITAYLDKEIQNPQSLKFPERLLNQVVLMTSNSAMEISDTIYENLCTIKADFETRTKLNLYENIVRTELDVDDDPNIVFKKPSAIEKVTRKGRQVAMSGLGFGGIGSAVAAIGGGVLGFLGGGPFGVLPGAALAISIVMPTASAAGVLVGAVKAVKKPSEDDMYKIKGDIQKYINQTVNDWRVALPKNIKDISYKLIKSLRDSIEENRRTIEADIKALQYNANLSKEKQMEEQKKTMAVKNGFSKLATDLSTLSSMDVEDAYYKTEKQSVPQEAAKGTEPPKSGDFSHLED